MPPGARKDDRYFGGDRGAAAKAWESMRRNYGRDAEHIYYGSIAKRKKRAGRSKGVGFWR